MYNALITQENLFQVLQVQFTKDKRLIYTLHCWEQNVY